MSNKLKEVSPPHEALKNEAARMRWQLFHRAIAYAKESNRSALDGDCGSQAEAETQATDSNRSSPVLSVIR